MQESELLKIDIILFICQCIRKEWHLNVRTKMVIPSLPALFPNSAIHILSNLGPFSKPKAINQLDKNPTKI